MTERESITTGNWKIEELDAFIKQAASAADAGERITFISKLFLGTGYRESTLIGDEIKAEVLVINLAGIDCFTFIDYVEAMRLSASFGGFKENLKKVRYRGGVVSFKGRNHFFSDWVEFNPGVVSDVTDDVGLGDIKTIRKVLNLKKDGTLFVPGIAPVEREIKYIPSSAIDEAKLTQLKNGDYIGIYSDLPGLDVSHVGILIREFGRLILRHASSKKEIRKVVDQDFMEYVKNKPGIIVLRAK